MAPGEDNVDATDSTEAVEAGTTQAGTTQADDPAFTTDPPRAEARADDAAQTGAAPDAGRRNEPTEPDRIR